MSTFFLVRHAHASWTPDEGRPLSSLGQEDARCVADILQRYSIHAIYSSPSRRARQTVAPLAARLNLPIQLEPDLRERQLGSLDHMEFIQAVEATWRDPSFAYPEGETNAAAQQRGLAVIHKLQAQHPADHAVLATHGNLMALVLQAIQPSVGFAFWQSLTMPDIYAFGINRNGKSNLNRLWQEDS